MPVEKRRETTRGPSDHPRAAATIGANVRRLREAAGVRQDDVAAAARQLGIAWARSSVTTLERGERDLSVEELALLPTILASACRRPGAYPLSALLPDDVEVMLTPRCATTGRALRAMLSGKGTATERPFRLVPTQHERQALAEVTALAKRYRLDPVLVATDVDDAADQVLELRAAERLGVTALEVSCAAFSRWGRSLTEHRDEQLGDDYETERAQRSARGHVTRRLLDELADHIASKAKTTTKTTAAPRAAKRG